MKLHQHISMQLKILECSLPYFQRTMPPPHFVSTNLLRSMSAIREGVGGFCPYFMMWHLHKCDFKEVINYKQAISEHRANQRADEEKIQSWRHALFGVANCTGYHFNPRQEYEYQFIERIVKEILRKIIRPLHVCEYPVGLEARVKKITSLLQIGSNDKAMMVGICGMGGIGKTTAARALYNSIADNFDGWCFLHDVKENSKKDGLAKMQEAMLLDILGLDIKIQNAHRGVQEIKMRIKQKKILLILDGIDNNEQLEKLAGDCSWFGDGSRIIITTRDDLLLTSREVQTVYPMEALNAEESLKLLTWKAFKNHQVDPSYMGVLASALDDAKGVPLDIEVIGSKLCEIVVNIERESRNLVIWKFVGGASAINGLVCFGLSSTYDMSFGKFGFVGGLFYLLVSLLIGWLIICAKRIPVSREVQGVVAAILFAVITSISLLIDKLVAGKSPDLMTIISYGSLAVMSLSVSRKLELGFETGFSALFLQLFAAQLYKIKWTLLPVAFVMSSVIIILRHYYSESGVQSPSSITSNLRHHLARDRSPNSVAIDIGN